MDQRNAPVSNNDKVEERPHFASENGLKKIRLLACFKAKSCSTCQMFLCQILKRLLMKELGKG